jgi:hypothetical protein
MLAMREQDLKAAEAALRSQVAAGAESLAEKYQVRAGV